MRIINRSIFYIAIVIVLNTFLSTSYAEDGPRWRGAAFDGTASPSSHPFSGQFELRVRWKRSLGAGYSGVVVADGKAVTMYSDGKNDYVVALSSDNGEEQWKFLLGETFPPRDGSSGGPVSTPAIDRGVVYALGPRGTFVALNLTTCKKHWHHDLVVELNALTPHWGFTTSPLVVANRVVVLTGGTPERLVTAFDCETGRRFLNLAPRSTHCSRNPNTDVRKKVDRHFVVTEYNYGLCLERRSREAIFLSVESNGGIKDLLRNSRRSTLTIWI